MNAPTTRTQKGCGMSSLSLRERVGVRGPLFMEWLHRPVTILAFEPPACKKCEADALPLNFESLPILSVVLRSLIVLGFHRLLQNPQRNGCRENEQTQAEPRSS